MDRYLPLVCGCVAVSSSSTGKVRVHFDLQTIALLNCAAVQNILLDSGLRQSRSSESLLLLLCPVVCAEIRPRRSTTIPCPCRLWHVTAFYLFFCIFCITLCRVLPLQQIQSKGTNGTLCKLSEEQNPCQPQQEQRHQQPQEKQN